MDKPIFQEGDQVVCTMDRRYRGKIKEVNSWPTGSGMVIFIYDVYLDKPFKVKEGHSITGFMFFGWQLEKIT